MNIKHHAWRIYSRTNFLRQTWNILKQILLIAILIMTREETESSMKIQHHTRKRASKYILWNELLPFTNYISKIKIHFTKNFHRQSCIFNYMKIKLRILWPCSQTHTRIQMFVCILAVETSNTLQVRFELVNHDDAIYTERVSRYVSSTVNYCNRKWKVKIWTRNFLGLCSDLLSNLNKKICTMHSR